MVMWYITPKKNHAPGRCPLCYKLLDIEEGNTVLESARVSYVVHKSKSLSEDAVLMAKLAGVKNFGCQATERELA